MSRRNFSVNSHSIVCLNIKELLDRSRRKIWSLKDWHWTRTHNNLVQKRILSYLAKLDKRLSCDVSTYLYGAFDTVCHYHVTYEFQSEFTLYSSLNNKELLAQNRNHIGTLSDSSRVQTHSHLVCKWTIECRFILKLVRDMIIAQVTLG